MGRFGFLSSSRLSSLLSSAFLLRQNPSVCTPWAAAHCACLARTVGLADSARLRACASVRRCAESALRPIVSVGAKAGAVAALCAQAAPGMKKMDPAAQVVHAVRMAYASDLRSHRTLLVVENNKPEEFGERAALRDGVGA